MRENVSVVDEDADGNKKVPFAVGLRIRADRQAPGSPVYELKAIFKAKSGAARCHVWEKEGLLAKPEILVVFSPAGTPDTVKHFWGDVWSGWLEDELRQVSGIAGDGWCNFEELLTSLHVPLVCVSWAAGGFGQTDPLLLLHQYDPLPYDR